MTRRRDVYFSPYGSTLAQCCAEAWASKFAFFGHAGQVFMVLARDEWHPTGVGVKELAS